MHEIIFFSAKHIERFNMGDGYVLLEIKLINHTYKAPHSFFPGIKSNYAINKHSQMLSVNNPEGLMPIYLQIASLDLSLTFDSL